MTVEHASLPAGPLAAFKRIEDAGGPSWKPVQNLPYGFQHGTDTFIRLKPSPRGKARASVNGYPVMGGFQIVETGDIIRIANGKGQVSTYRLMQASGTCPEPGEGRRCAFTGLPINGQALRCLPCGRLVCATVAGQVGVCACKGSLESTAAQNCPAEELL